MTTPATLLSFIHHSLIPEFRDEVHHDIDPALVRFGITDSTFAALATAAGASGQLPSARQVGEAAKDVEVKAFRLRKLGKANETDMKNATNKLLGQLAPLLAAELAVGVTSADQQLDSARLSYRVQKLYHLTYCSPFRNSAPAAPDGFTSPDWQLVGNAVRSGGVAFSSLLPPSKRLCQAIADEFNDTLWPVVW